eukprot:1136981-Pelagomonas_calceolata.AAC.1
MNRRLDGGMDICPSGCFKGFEQGLGSVYSEHANALAIGISHLVTSVPGVFGGEGRGFIMGCVLCSRLSWLLEGALLLPYPEHQRGGCCKFWNQDRDTGVLMGELSWLCMIVLT